jgi:hypothetical protein
VSESPWTYWWASTGRKELSRLLWERWDPIGFPTDDGRQYKPPEDEYEFCVDGLGELLRSGGDAATVQSHLEGIENDSIGLRPAEDRSEVAAEIVRWYAQAQRKRPT